MGCVLSLGSYTWTIDTRQIGLSRDEGRGISIGGLIHSKVSPTLFMRSLTGAPVLSLAHRLACSAKVSIRRVSVDHSVLLRVVIAYHSLRR